MRLGTGGEVMRLAEVRLQEGESLENALRRFKRKVQQEDIIKEVRRHSFYLKPGEKKRVKQALARKRAQKRVAKSRTNSQSRAAATTQRSSISLGKVLCWTIALLPGALRLYDCPEFNPRETAQPAIAKIIRPFIALLTLRCYSRARARQ